MAGAEQQQLIEKIHQSGRQLMLSITGGGSEAISALLEVPGASATVLGAVVPYAPKALASWLGGPVDHYCSERTARAMAMGAFQLARQFSSDETARLRGIGATASLATNRPKRGPHRVHVAWQSPDTTVALSCELEKDRRTRAEEEAIATALVLAAVAEACGVETDGFFEPAIAERVQRREQHAETAWAELLRGQRNSVAIPDNGEQRESGTPQVLFPGAFNPLHAGHEQMAKRAATHLGGPVTFELSILNVDKPPLDFIEISDRLRQLAGRQVLLTRTPTFAEKSALAPGCVFVVGIDTLIRIGDTRYYGGDEAQRDAAIATIAKHGCRFLVFGRTLDNRFMNVADADIPTGLRKLSEAVPESVFRDDVSSSELRRSEHS
jgi:nicotinamide mononucleotide (NMN) deamidase PncC